MSGEDHEPVEHYEAKIIIYSDSLLASDLAELFPISGRAWNNPNWPSKGPRRVPRSGIEFVSGLSREHSFEDHVDRLLGSVDPALDAITAQLRDPCCWGWLAIYTDTTELGGGISVSPELVQVASRLGLSITFSYWVISEDDLWIVCELYRRPAISGEPSFSSES